MLPLPHRQAYQALLSKLLALQTVSTANSDTADIEQVFQSMQQIFQAQVLNLGSDELDLEISSRWQSLQTEMQRSMRLLSTDMVFLRSSRQAATSEQRLATVRDRTQKLIDYCQAMLQY